MRKDVEQAERQHLAQVLTQIRGERDALEQFLSGQDAEIRRAKDDLWQNSRDYDHAEKAMVRMSIDQSTMSAENHANYLHRLDSLCDSTWFGCFDFCENAGAKNTSKVAGLRGVGTISGCNAKPYYIGIHAFHDPKSGDAVVHDWRAPVSGMFYDFEPGPAGYQSPAGEVQGQIERKRQYRISKGELEFVFETAVSVQDSLLQNELGRAADEKMRNIVSTIQRDQNAIIRNDSSDVLIIQGVAGSGKTSIALHRVAWLLYRHNNHVATSNAQSSMEDLRSEDILIISPNKVFSDYISNVLPELGEENIPEMIMEELAARVLKHKVRYESFSEQVARLVEQPDESYSERIQFKAGPEYVDLLNRYLRHITGSRFQAEDLHLGPYTIPAEFIDGRYHAYTGLSPQKRVKKVAEDVIGADPRLRLSLEQKNSVEPALKKMIHEKTPLQYYKEMFEWMERPDLFTMAKGRRLEYADLFPLAYLTMRLKGWETYDAVKHLLVDEMQDYTYVQYKVLEMLFPCRKTILGDISQKINPWSASGPALIQSVFAGAELMRLTKSYRSTWEITQFAQKICPDQTLEAVERHGPAPLEVSVESEKELIAKVGNTLDTFRQENEYRSLAVICRTSAQVKKLAKALQAEDVFVMQEDSQGFHSGIWLTTPWLAKGLEFDQVVIPWADEENYGAEMGRNLLYIACTRAMHGLVLIRQKTI